MNETQIVWELVKSAGTTGVLVACVWWLNKERDKSEAKREVERQEYRTMQNNRVEYLEQKIMACEADRAVLHKKIDEVQAEVRRDLRDIICANKKADTR